MLDCFQLLSLLKINYFKYGMIVKGKSNGWRELMAARLGRQLIKLLVVYLGIPLGANPKKAAT